MQMTNSKLPTLRQLVRSIGSLMLLAAIAANAAAQDTDRVHRTSGGAVTGNISDISPREITISQRGRPQAIPVNEISSVSFGGEPLELTQARVHAGNRHFERALETLGRVDPASISDPRTRGDVEFYTAMCRARLALAGNGSIAEAGTLMYAYVRAHSDSHHYFHACELLGDLLVGTGDHQRAATMYGELAKAPWPEYQMRSLVLVGQMRQAQGQYQQAADTFEKVLAMQATGEGAQEQIQSARLGKALCLAEAGQADQAIEILQSLINESDAQQAELFARAYNALGQCYRKADKSHDALLAYLHVDILFANVPQQHAEALASLVDLWTQVGDASRSREARGRLAEKYPDSRWAKEVVQ